MLKFDSTLIIFKNKFIFNYSVITILDNPYKIRLKQYSKLIEKLKMLILHANNFKFCSSISLMFLRCALDKTFTVVC